MRLRTGAGGFQEAVADLHTLERLNAHDRGGQSRVQSAVGLHIRADAGRHTVSQHFNHAAQRIGGLLGLVDAFDDAGFGLFVQRTDRRGIKRFQIVGGGQRQVGVGLHATKRHHVGYGADAERLIQELLGHLAQSHTGGGLTGAGALQYRAGVVKTILAHAGQIGVARARAAQRRIAAFARQVMVECIGAHDLGPLRPFGVGDFDGHRRAEGQAVAYTGQQTDLVLLELHAGTATISKSTACQCGNDIVRANTHAGRQPFNHGHQCFSVRLPCRLPTQHNFPRFMCVRLCVRLARG